MPTIYDILSNVDFVPPSLPPLDGKGRLVVLEDNEAVIKMTVKGRSPNMRHVPRVHRVDLDGLFNLFKTDKAIAIRYVGTKQQIADILTKGQFTAQQWGVLVQLAQVQPPGVPLRATASSAAEEKSTASIFLSSRLRQEWVPTFSTSGGTNEACTGLLSPTPTQNEQECITKEPSEKDTFKDILRSFQQNLITVSGSARGDPLAKRSFYTDLSAYDNPLTW